MNTQQLALGAVWYVAFLFSTTCHEAAHALIAKWGGDMTAAEGGQVTLNPIPHIRRSPFGMVVMPILSFALGGWMIGWASAPFDPNWERSHPRRAARMALGGPAANFTIMLLAAIAIRAGLMLGYFAVPLSIYGYSTLVQPASGSDPTFATLGAQHPFRAQPAAGDVQSAAGASAGRTLRHHAADAGTGGSALPRDRARRPIRAAWD